MSIETNGEGGASPRVISGGPGRERTAAEPATLRDYLHVLRRRRGIIIVTLVLVLGPAVVLSFFTSPIYRASAIVAPTKAPPAVLLVGGQVNALVDRAIEPPTLVGIVAVIKGDAVREDAIRRLAPTMGAEAARNTLERKLSVRQVRNSDLIRISVDHTNPKVAAAMANAVANSFIQLDQQAQRVRATETRQFLAEELALADDRLRASEDALVEFKNQRGNVSLAEETTLNIRKLADLQAQRVDIRLQQSEIRARVAATRAGLASQAKISPTQWAPSPVIATLQNQLATLEIELSGLRKVFTPRHPAIVNTEAKINETKRQLDAELARSLQPGQYGVDPVYQQLIQQVQQDEVTLAANAARLKALAAGVGGYESRVQEVPSRETELARFTRSATEAEQIRALISARFQEARIIEGSIGSAITMVEVANVPQVPVRPKPGAYALLGASVGLMLGVIAAFVAEQLDETVRSAEEVERMLGAPVLGAIPLLPRNGDGARAWRGGLPVPMAAETNNDGQDNIHPRRSSGWGAPQWQATEAYRDLWAQLSFTVPQFRRKCLVVTSALPGEGKSTVVANLALAFARAACRVWLVDADLRNPTLARLFPETHTSGLTGFLSGRGQVKDIVRPTTAESNLAVVAGGPPVVNSTELLSSQQWTHLVEQARAAADVVLIDTPPALPVADAEVVGSQADGALLVVRLGKTDRRSLTQAHQRLQRAGVEVAGAIVNFVPATDWPVNTMLYYYRYWQRGRRDRPARPARPALLRMIVAITGYLPRRFHRFSTKSSFGKAEGEQERPVRRFLILRRSGR